MNDKMRFSKYAQRLREKFPSWSKIRKDPDAIGSQFLSVIGLQFDEIEWMLEYANAQRYIGSMDIEQVDIIYKARIPNSLRPEMAFRISSDGHVLDQSMSLESFLKKKESLSVLQYETRYYIDYEKKYIYVKYPFGKDEDYTDGKLMLTLLNGEDAFYHEVMRLIVHPVWNFFDEIGLLVGTARLHGERNADYKERILDVFRRPASSAYTGLKNGIARELGLVHQVEWQDASKPLVLAQPRVDVMSISVDGVGYQEELISKDQSGRTILEGIPSDAGVKKTVRYVAGLDLHELHDEDDDIQEELYDIDGHATELLQYYVKRVRNQVPVMWGQWRWDQGFWNIADEATSGLGYLPTSYDGNFGGWTRYTPREG